MYQFRFYNPVNVYFGMEQLSQLPFIIRHYGERVLVLYSESFSRCTNYMDLILNMIRKHDIYTIAISMSTPNPKGAFIDKISNLCKREKIQVLIGIGGGTVLDSVKAIAASACMDENCREWITGKIALKKALPVIALPTTAATGSEMNSGGLISFPERKEKLSFGHPLLFPKAAFIVPQFTASQNREQTAAGCADVLFHIMEGNYFTRGEKMGTHLRIMEELMRDLIRYARIVVEDLKNYEARANLCIIASWALNGFLENGTGRIPVCHAMEHEISGYYDIPHAQGMAIIVPKWLRYIAEKGCKEQIAEFESELDSEHEILLMLASFGTSIAMSVDDIGYQNPDLLYFYGHVNGKPAQFIQNINQLNFLITAVERSDKSKPARRIGFTSGSSDN